MNLNREQIKCFESPIKASIVSALRVWKQATAKELAQAVGGNANTLYQHLRQLIAVGLVRVAELRPSETKPEAVYELTAPEFYMQGEGQEYRESVFRSAMSVMRLAQRHYELGRPLDARTLPKPGGNKRGNFIGPEPREILVPGVCAPIHRLIFAR